MAKGTLSRKHQIFANEYLIDFNGTRAAKAAGYSERSAYSTAHEILRNPEVKEYLEQEISSLNELAFLERHRVLSELKNIGYPSQENQSMIQYTAAERLKALYLIGKSVGLFWEKPEIKEERHWEKAMKIAMEEFEAGVAAGKYPEIKAT